MVKIKNRMFILSLALMIFGFSCIQGNSFAQVNKVVVDGELVKTFENGSLYKVRDKEKVRDVIVYNDGRIEGFLEAKHGSYFKHEKVAKELDKLIKDNENQTIPVAIWFKDLDYISLDEEARQLTKIDDFKSSDRKKVQTYIETKRELAKKQYISQNNDYYSKYLPYEELIFISSYAPYIIVNMQIKKIEKLAMYDDIAYFELINDTKKIEEVKHSVPNINANYTRDSIGLRGSDIKVGILEMYYCDKSNDQLRDRDIIFDVSDAMASADTGVHATKIASIIVGNTEGIAPDAKVYMAAAKNRIQDYQKIEWLVSQGVNVINYSSGYSAGAGTYSDMAKWIDHLSVCHNVTFVKSAGNGGSGSYITDPGMAYNGLTVGSIFDNDSYNEPDWTDDSFSSYSSFREIEGGYKPDLTAPGQGIEVAGYISASGTSYSAAHVTGVIAQIFQSKPDLMIKSSALNALLKAATNHKTAWDYNDYTLISNFSNMEGAGVIDAKGSYDLALAGNYIQTKLYNSEFPYIQSITVSSCDNPIRITLNWLKQNTLLAEGTVDVRDISDLDLYIIDPNWNLLASSTTANNNTELIEFTPDITGTYTILVDGYILENDYELLGLAWYQ